MNSQQNLNEERLLELKKELQLQKKRFIQATQNTALSLQETLSITTWIRDYPIQTAVFMTLSGFLTAHLFYSPKPFDEA